MSDQTELRLTGSGGQGLILAGIILAEAAILDGKNAIQSQSYGPEARGGASKAEVLISKNIINFPKVQHANFVLALTQVAADKYAKTIVEDGILLVDESVNLPEGIKAAKIVKAPIIKIAKEVIGKAIVSNIVALGAIVALTDVVSRESIEKAILSRVPKGTEDLNKSALYEGFKLA
ncbi:2-oxoacid:acceptor oxidoreductase family protein [Helicovermis profundi]|uniref:2-oxoacid:acceptor oxidoreductase family protein n=1 Tax=Helicovermis profundi TaxID=3065157 RepID=A0AAU9E3T3_9FIRM|nr:2-oxoacid:acceptor oxidoreductase family protein [Clostridia bacterium S502]